MKTAWLSLGLCLSLGLFVACGGDDDGGDVDSGPNATVDGMSGSTTDGMPGSTTDGMPGNATDGMQGGTGAASLGQSCDPQKPDSWPDGYTCLNFQTGAWLSIQCSGQNDPVCSTGYTGPGFASCYLHVTPSGGGTTTTYCGVVCEDRAGGQICDEDTCDGMCPGDLECTASIMGTSGEVAKGCQ